MKKILKTISLVLSISMALTFFSCGSPVTDPATPTNPTDNPTSPNNKTGIDLGIKGPDTSGKDFIEVQFKENEDGSITETRTTTYKDGLVKVSEITKKLIQQNLSWKHTAPVKNSKSALMLKEISLKKMEKLI